MLRGVNGTQATYAVLNMSALSSCSELAAAPTVAEGEQTPLPSIDVDYLRAREDRAVVRALDEAKNINPKATSRCQAVFDALSKACAELHARTRDRKK